MRLMPRISASSSYVIHRPPVPASSFIWCPASVPGIQLPARVEPRQGVTVRTGSPLWLREAMTAPLVVRLLKTCPDDMKGRRDRVLLAIGFAGALRRSELVAPAGGRRHLAG
jgi:hypothetical protein